ncbi:MAG: HAD family hydrolase [Ruminococcaceae bacterium]|nr:HAD family hydrolase [Oscillospiraceae bacterium]
MICQYKTLILDAYGVIFKEYSCKSNEIESLTMDEGFLDFANKIKSKYEIVLLSNDDSEQSKKITAYYGIDEYFSAKIISSEANCKKPSLQIFDITLERIGRKPSECIFVDWDVKSLLAAEEVGISTVLFNRNEDNFDGMTVYSFKELFDIIG